MKQNIITLIQEIDKFLVSRKTKPDIIYVDESWYYQEIYPVTKGKPELFDIKIELTKSLETINFKIV